MNIDCLLPWVQNSDCFIDRFAVVDASEKMFVMFCGVFGILGIKTLFDRPMKWRAFPELRKSESVNQEKKS